MEAERGAAPRAAILLAAVAITAGVAYLAFLIGAWGFNTRRYGQHDGRLRKLLLASPRVDQVVRAFEDEGSPLVAAPADARELEKVAAERGRDKAREVVEKGTRWGQTRVFVAGDMVYFIFFDAGGVMRDFVYVTR
jgi:hypothetical protein